MVSSDQNFSKNIIADGCVWQVTIETRSPESANCNSLRFAKATRQDNLSSAWLSPTLIALDGTIEEYKMNGCESPPLIENELKKLANERKLYGYAEYGTMAKDIPDAGAFHIIEVNGHEYHIGTVTIEHNNARILCGLLVSIKPKQEFTLHVFQLNDGKISAGLLTTEQGSWKKAYRFCVNPADKARYKRSHWSSFFSDNIFSSFIFSSLHTLEEAAKDAGVEPRALQELIRFANSEKIFGKAQSQYEQQRQEAINAVAANIGGTVGSTSLQRLWKDVVNDALDNFLRNADSRADTERIFGQATETLRTQQGKPPGKYASAEQARQKTGAPNKQR